MCSSDLIGISARMLGAMAGDHYLPEAFAAGGDGRPSRLSVIVAVAGAGIASFLAPSDTGAAFASACAASLVILGAALIVLRTAHPMTRRDYGVPGGTQAVALCAAVSVTGGAFLVIDGVANMGLWWAVGAALLWMSGPCAWVALTISVKRGRPNRPIPLEMSDRWFDLARPGTPELAGPVTVGVPYDYRVMMIVPSGAPRPNPNQPVAPVSAA